MADLLIVLGVALALTLCTGVGWTVVSRLTARTTDLERQLAAAELTLRSLDADLDDVFQKAEVMTEALFAHECKPSTAAHSRPKPAARKAPVVQGTVKVAGNSAKKAVAKKAASPAKKAPPRRQSSPARSAAKRT